MEQYILPLTDWFYRHCNDGYWEFISALEERAKIKKLGLPIYSENYNLGKPKKIKSKKKKKKKVKRIQKYTNKNFRRYRQK